jgi:ATP-dependent exoDNAse (exonuclease V) alpha subunit
VYQSTATYPGARRADRRTAEDFKQVRHHLRFCIGARVMLVQNRLYGVDLPRLGLMHGAMGVVVGALHADDAFTLLVRFPSYTGDPIYGHDPLVIPVAPEEIHAKTSPGTVRCQLPLRLAHGITGHKSQGRDTVSKP